VLLRHYVRLGARTLDLSVDPAFGGAVDGLILVDLASAPERVVERYLGAYATERFLAFHAGTRSLDDSR